MKIYVVKIMDTNCIISIGEVFLHHSDAKNYAIEEGKKRDDISYWVSE